MRIFFCYYIDMSLSSKGSCGSNSSSLSSTAGELAVLQNEKDFKDRLEGAIRNKNSRKPVNVFLDSVIRIQVWMSFHVT